MANDYVFDMDKKFVKNLQELNQDVKNVFNTYTVIYGTMIITGPKERGDKGLHVILAQDVSFLADIMEYCESESCAAMFDAVAIYRAIKDYKKYIIGMYIEHDSLLFEIGGDVEDMVIGNIVDTSSSKYSMVMPVASNVLSTRSECVLIYPDIENLAERLVKNEFFTVGIGGKEIRLTKSLMPGLKKNDEIKIGTCWHNIKNIYNTILQNTKPSGLITIHWYLSVTV